MGKLLIIYNFAVSGEFVRFLCREILTCVAAVSTKIFKLHTDIMKKFLFPMLAVLAALGAQARTLTPAEALSRLQTDPVAAKASAARGVAASQPHLAFTQTTETGQPAVYVFDNQASNQVLFVSADDVVAPLLGYADATPAGTEMPPQLKWWLEQYASQIAYAQLNGFGDSGQSAPGAVLAPATDRTPIAPLVKTTWDQGAPYNNDCPKSGTQATYTGCVATAMAQLMNYFKYPEKGTGTVSVTFNNQTLSMNLATTTLNWANMLDSYPTATSGTLTQRRAVSTLMKACGYSVDMSYGTSGSGAVSSEVVSALVNNFNYDSGCSWADRSYYSRDDWHNLIYNNLKNCGPVLYSGRSTDGGHAFICDGYSDDGFYHFNWGWSGAYNGYYSLEALNPDGQGIGGFAGGYNFMQGAVIGARLPSGTIPAIDPVISSYEGLTGTTSGSTLTLGGGFQNRTGATLNADIFAKFIPAGGGTAVYAKIYTVNLEPWYMYSTLSLNLSGVSLSNGTYDVYVVSTAAGSSAPYYPMAVENGSPDHFRLTKSGNSYSVQSISAGTPTISLSNVFTEIYYSSKYQHIPVNPSISYTVTNNTQFETMGGIAFQFVSGSTVIAYTTGQFYDLMPGETQSETMTLEVSLLYVPTLNSDYDLYLYNPNQNASASRLDTSCSRKVGTVRLVEYPATTLTCSNFAIDGDAQNVDPYNVPFKGTVNCTAGVYGNTLLVGLFRGQTNICQGNVASVNLKAGESADFSGTLAADLALNTSYNAGLFYLDMTRGSYVQIDGVAFTTAKTGGVDDLDSESADGLKINMDGRKLIVASSTRIGRVVVVSANGSEVYVPVANRGIAAVADMESLPVGIYIVSATDAAGNATTRKIALR